MLKHLKNGKPMNSLVNRLKFSSIHIEPVDSNEYNQYLVEQLTKYHKQTFLRCVRKEPDFLNNADLILDERLVNELNKKEPKCNRNDWISIFEAWINFLRRCSDNLTPEDMELSRYIRANQSKKPTRRKSEPKSLEDFSTHCRICLASSSSKMLFLFKDTPQCREEMSLLDKLNYCSCFATKVSADDRLPQYICMSCSILVENSYQLKVLCRIQSSFRDKFRELENDLCRIEVDVDENNEQVLPSIVEENNEISPAEPITSPDTLDKEIESEPSQNCRCDICGSVFLNKQSIRDHMKQHHKKAPSVNKPFQCPECDKLFRVKFSLTLHLRTHTNERPYKCEICGKCFKTYSAMSNHHIVHTQTKDFSCSICSFSTNTKANLNVHTRRHTGVQPYECKHCSMKFRTASSAAKHMRNIHEKQKSNKCEQCKRSFFTRESLRKHCVIHTGLKPFYCPQTGCSCMYSWYNGLKKHIRAQHIDDNVKLPSEKFYFDKIKDVIP